MNRLERLYAINETIRRASPRPVSAAALANRFSVSRRTIERDLAALRETGAPLFATRGRRGGHRTLEDAKNVVLTLSIPEVTAAVIALAATGPDLPYGSSGRVAVDRLLDVLPDAVRVGVDELRAKVRVSAVASESLDPRLRGALEQAVQRGRVVNLRYVDGKGVATERKVDPVGFLHNEGSWFLIAWCHLREAGRMFRFDRITGARATKTSAAHHDFDDTAGWLPYETGPP